MQAKEGSVTPSSLNAMRPSSKHIFEAKGSTHTTYHTYNIPHTHAHIHIYTFVHIEAKKLSGSETGFTHFLNLGVF